MSDLPHSERITVAQTSLPPCCLRIHPQDTSLIVIGTYNLDKLTGTRDGSLDLYKFDTKLTLLNSTATESAILDIKFSPFDATLLVSAHSTGNIQIWQIDPSNASLKHLSNHQLFDKDILITSIFFSPRDEGKLVATLTSGEAALVDLNNLGTVEIFDTTHDLECWTANFGELGELSNVVYTGGDDAKLIAHDLRMNSAIWSTNYRHHDAGVVSILSPNNEWNTTNSHHLWTGSYDDRLRVMDLRVIDKKNPQLIEGYIPQVKQNENLGGGVWRLIPSPLSQDNRVMSCCMYDGARIIDTTNDKGEFEVKRYFKEDHESMCYGGDWSSDGKYIATCSFYDNVVQLWSPDQVNN